ncbi:enoyl-CoA hydratase [Streptomyces sulfonofaciens]|uniref:Enoyl-CoA hydratase n=1 Tax=Streptomyces sulfonofaciens TaxID=68272 RepID=A0A919GKK9_9ACTN|nr:enoyl-CoA hydratase/isomerase family protein [Streptomyces sulfonofaciens]GHH86207.1 enoyl-CoA hydratase [Streptomyces sulfonofaciens]
MELALEAGTSELDDGVLTVTFNAPPLNLVGPEVVHDIVALLDAAQSPDIRVIVFDSADPDFFLAHLDVAKVRQYTAELERATGPYHSGLGALYNLLSTAPAVTIAKVRGRTRGAGSEFVLACDMSFAARENAVFGQPEAGLGLIPGAGGLQHLARLLGRHRAMEVVLGSVDVDADLAERYGWVNRALPDAELDTVVDELAHRIARFPADAVIANKQAINEVTLADTNTIMNEKRIFHGLIRGATVQERIARLTERGFQSRSQCELDLAHELGNL